MAGTVTPQGYRMLSGRQTREPTGRWKRVPEHRPIAARMLGLEELPDEWCVHHEDEDKLNNDPSNLRVFASSALHARWHALLRLHRQTHCIHGHEFTPENTARHDFPDGRWKRTCRACDRAKQKRHQPRREERRAAARAAGLPVV